MSKRAAPNDTFRLLEEAGSVLAGHPPEVIGFILADLTATWLAGQVVPGDPEATERLRGEVLGYHVAAVRRLTKINARQIGADLLASREGGSA